MTGALELSRQWNRLQTIAPIGPVTRVDLRSVTVCDLGRFPWYRRWFSFYGKRVRTLNRLASEVVDWLPLLPEISLSRLTGELLVAVVKRKSATAGSLDGWGWREMEVLSIPCFGKLEDILASVEENGVWREGIFRCLYCSYSQSGWSSWGEASVCLSCG